MPQLEVQDLPKGWRPVAFRPPKINENFFEYGAVRFATRDFDISDSRLILERIRQRIVLESTGENRTPNYGEWCRINGNFVRCKALDCTEQHAIWREIRIEEEAKNDGASWTGAL